MNKIRKGLKLQVSDWLFIATLAVVSVNPWKNVLPMNTFQFVMLLLLAYLFLLSKVFVNRELIIMGAVIAFSTLLVNPANISATKVKNIFGLLLTAVTYYSYVSKNTGNLQRIFRIYIKVMIFAAVLGLLQEAAYILNIEFLANSNNYWIGVRYPDLSGPFLRINSIASEPAHFAYMLYPVVYCAILNLARIGDAQKIISRKESWVVITALLLTFSLLAYFGLAIITLYIGYRKGLTRIAKYMVITAIFIVVAYKSSNAIKGKVDSIINVKRNYYSTANLSAFAVYSNIKISWRAFCDNPIFGSGLNTYELHYDKYIGQYFDTEKLYMKINREDAASLYLRIPAEFGLLGIFSVVIFLLIYRLYAKNVGVFGIINTASLCFILLYSLRTGTYLSQFLWFFIALYRQSYIQLKCRVSTKRDSGG